MRFFKYLPIIGFFSAFYSPFGMISYFCAFKGKSFRFSLSDSLFFIFSIAIFLYHLFKFDFVSTLLTFRFYFGFFIFFIFFKCGGTLPVKKLFLVLMLIIPLEAILINTVISAVNMPNFPSADAYSHFNPGGYQRPYSFAGNSSVASSLVIAIASLFPYSLTLFNVVLFLTLIFSSGSGFLSLLVYLFTMKLRFTFVFFLFFIPVLFFIFHSAIDFVDGLGLKLNSSYLVFLFYFKLEQIVELFHGFTIVDFLFGNLDSIKSEGYGGDFGWLYFILSYGFVSFLIVVSYILTKLNKYNFGSIFILLLSTFHYPVIFYLSGQIILGYVMAIDKRNGK